MRHRITACTVLVLALVLAGCGDGHRTTWRGATGPTPTATATSAGPSPTPAATTTAPRPPRPTASPPRPAPTVDLAKLGLKRSTGGRAVALTFDDGPHPQWTPQVLDYLRQNGVKATFCVVGVKVRQYPHLVARIVREGHSLCNHSWGHDFDLGSRSPELIRADLVRTNDTIRQAVPGARVGYYRQPGGKWTPAVVKVARAMGMVPLHWDVDPQDWAKPTAAVIAQRVEQHARPGSIVLMHDGGGDRTGTVTACPAVLSWLKQRYGIVRLK